PLPKDALAVVRAPPRQLSMWSDGGELVRPLSPGSGDYADIVGGLKLPEH
ncbi:hypothetical protein TorRG33x02_006550, partial [Trema orientale]